MKFIYYDDKGGIYDTELARLAGTYSDQGRLKSYTYRNGELEVLKRDAGDYTRVIDDWETPRKEAVGSGRPTGTPNAGRTARRPVIGGDYFRQQTLGLKTTGADLRSEEELRALFSQLAQRSTPYVTPLKAAGGSALAINENFLRWRAALGKSQGGNVWYNDFARFAEHQVGSYDARFTRPAGVSVELDARRYVGLVRIDIAVRSCYRHPTHKGGDRDAQSLVRAKGVVRGSNRQPESLRLDIGSRCHSCSSHLFCWIRRSHGHGVGRGRRQRTSVRTPTRNVG